MAPFADTLIGMPSHIRRHPVVAFFVLAYLGSWICWAPTWLSRNGIGLLPYELSLPAVVGVNQVGLVAGPLGAALLVTGITEGRAGIGRLLRRCVKGRVAVGWWLLALAVIPAVLVIACLLAVPATAPLSVATVIQLVVMGIGFLPGGPIQEEPGWRGFALPRMQQRMHPLVAAVVLGVLHCAWHAPLFLTQEWDTARGNPAELAAYLIMVVALSVVLAWLTNGSGGSVLMAILGHNSVNWVMAAVVPLMTGLPASNVPAAAAVTGLAVVAIVATRGRLAASTGTAVPPGGQTLATD